MSWYPCCCPPTVPTVPTYCCAEGLPAVIHWTWARVSGTCTAFDAAFAALSNTLYADTRPIPPGQSTAVYQWFDVPNPPAYPAPPQPKVYFGCNTVQTGHPVFSFTTYFGTGRILISPGACYTPSDSTLTPPAEAGHINFANIDPVVCLDPFALTFRLTVYYSIYGNDFVYTPQCCPAGSTTVYETYLTR